MKNTEIENHLIEFTENVIKHSDAVKDMRRRISILEDTIEDTPSNDDFDDLRSSVDDVHSRVNDIIDNYNQNDFDDRITDMENQIDDRITDMENQITDIEYILENIQTFIHQLKQHGSDLFANPTPKTSYVFTMSNHK